MKDVRATRIDLDGVSRELGSLKAVLELLADDINELRNVSFLQTLQKQIAGIVTNCSGAVADIEETLKKHEGGKVAKAAQLDAFGKGYIVKLGSSLEAHKSTLEIALDTVSLYVTHVNFEMTTNIRQDHSQRDQSRYARNTRGHYQGEYGANSS